MKKCFKCGDVKPLGDFYTHPNMADGHLNKCIICTRKDASRHRRNNIDAIRAYDLARSAKPHRRSRMRIISLVSNAVRDGRLERWPCWICGDEDVQAHHVCYDPGWELRVIWLCKEHHGQLHREHREWERKAV